MLHPHEIEISVVIPVFLSSGCIDELVERLKTSLSSLEVKFEVILVDDGSPDDSWALVARQCSLNTWLKGIRLSRNFGQHYAITAGLEAATGTWIVVMDCDLQEDPNDIERLYRTALEGYDLVLAKREGRTDSGPRIFFSRFFYALLNMLLDKSFDTRIGTLRIMSKRLSQHYLSLHERIRLFGPLVEWFGFPTTAISVQSHPSRRGRSSYTWRKLIRLAGDSLVLSSDKVLRVTMCGGLGVAAFSLLGGVYLLLTSLYARSPVLGWTSIIVTLTFFSGISVSLIGLIGLYLGKLLEEVRHRPLYVVESRLNHGEG